MLGTMERALRFLIDFAQVPVHSEQETVSFFTYPSLLFSFVEDLLSSRQNAIDDFGKKFDHALTTFHVSLSAQQLAAVNDISPCSLLLA